jgi:hypothetical protein
LFRKSGNIVAAGIKTHEMIAYAEQKLHEIAKYMVPEDSDEIEQDYDRSEDILNQQIDAVVTHIKQEQDNVSTVTDNALATTTTTTTTNNNSTKKRRTHVKTKLKTIRL